MKLIFLIFTTLLFSFESNAAWTTEDAVAEVEQRALDYFIENAHPITGMVLDRAANFGPNPPSNQVASIASTGFALAVLTNAASRGMVDPEAVEAYALKTLRFVETHVKRHNGWFLHWFNWATGDRMWDAEYSTIDTALFMAGALYASQVFSNSEISAIVTRLYKDLNFNDMLTNGGALPNKKTLSMGYMPETGYIAADWNMYAEEMILLLLGLGHPDQPLPPETWLALDRRSRPLPNSPTEVMGLSEALFVHQYSHLFVDFRDFKDGFHNYFENSVRITRYHRQLRDLQKNFLTLREGFWGFSAGDGPNQKYVVYSALNYQGTVCIGCTVGSAMYMPQEIMADVTDWLNSPYSSRIWGRYGLVDSIDVDQNFFSPWVLGITVGPIYLSIANSREDSSVWKEFMNIPAIQQGLARAGSARETVSQTLRLATHD